MTSSTLHGSKNKYLNSENDQNIGPVKGPVVFDPRKSQEKASDFLFEKTV